MRVLYVIDSLVAGGAERSLSALAPHLSANGVQLGVCYLKDVTDLREELQEGGATLFAPRGGPGRMQSLLHVRRAIQSWRPDLVHTTLFEADIAGRVAGMWCGTPVVSSLVNVSFGPAQLENPRLSSRKVRLARQMEAVTARSVRRFHAVAQHVAREMGRRLRLPEDRIEVIPRGRDPEVLGSRTPVRRIKVREELGAGPNATVVFAAARHEYQKGLDTLLRAFVEVRERVPNAGLIVAGRSGDVTEELEGLAEGLGLGGSVRFLGVRADVADLMCAADVFVLPSRWEGMPGVLIEAMALEVPIVATDLLPTREVLGEADLAELIPVNDAKALARGILRLHHDPDLAVMRTQRGRRRFLEKFTIDRSAHLMVEFYGRALGATDVGSVSLGEIRS